MSKSLEKLLHGYRQFRTHYKSTAIAPARETLAKAQTPRIMVIACSDSRANPAILTQAEVGEIFTVHHVANLVPPFAPESGLLHSTCAGLEFAVKYLRVEHIIVLGHSGCGGIRALMEGIDNSDFIGQWVALAAEAKAHVLKKYPDTSLDEQCSYCEKEALVHSLENLRTFPWINHALKQGTLALHAWYFDIKSGDIAAWQEKEEGFSPLIQDD